MHVRRAKKLGGSARLRSGGNFPDTGGGQFFYLYVALDVWSRKIVAASVFENECGHHASAMIEKAYEQESVDPSQLVLHADNGGPMKGATLLAKLQMLGIATSFSRPRVSDDNAFSEAAFRTFKYCDAFPRRPFASLEEAQKWTDEFVEWYNETHLHSAISYVTPGQRHRQEDKTILERRKRVYENAKKAEPSRWSGETRNWERIEEVTLNAAKADGHAA